MSNQGQHAKQEASIQSAIVATVAYADIFDYPLTASEIHRFLLEREVSTAQVDAVLSNGIVPKHLHHSDGFYTMPERTNIVEIRRRREIKAREMWPIALKYGAILARLPFVRMVAVTGSLAVNNVNANADIDYLVVAKNDRVWLTRAFSIALVYWASREGVTLCPNYFLAERALVLREETLYTARELAQMVPLSGLNYYKELVDKNGWMSKFLPNFIAHTELIATDPPSRTWRLVSRVAELVLRTPLGTRLERWERERKIAKFTSEGHNLDEARFGPDWCKGHFDAHSTQVMTRFSKQINDIEA